MAKNDLYSLKIDEYEQRRKNPELKANYIARVGIKKYIKFHRIFRQSSCKSIKPN
ncbi:MAG: hypothetical protein HWQ38_32875 [Nostoc sp. NMS7]|nr:hypothetical protein [Nostoc sp. NMS7]